MNKLKMAVKEVFQGVSAIGQFLMQMWAFASEAGPETLKQVRWEAITKERKYFILAFFGLTPLATIAAFHDSADTSTAHWILAFYYSTMWGMLFYFVFRPKINFSIAAKVFFVSILFSFVTTFAIKAILGVSIFEGLIDARNPILKFIGYFFSVGIPEEMTKASLLIYSLWFMRKREFVAKDILILGLLSGLGFGVTEGVSYQMNVNIYSDTRSEYFFLNVLRMTSLPFIHAIWTGIVTLFILRARQKSERIIAGSFLGLVVSSTLHALYDTFAGGMLGLFIAVASCAGFLGLIHLIENQNDLISWNISEKASLILRRVGARLIDALVCAPFVVGLIYATGYLIGRLVGAYILPYSAIDLSYDYGPAIIFAIVPGSYFGLCYSLYGKSLGKRLLGLIIKRQTGAGGFWLYFARELLYSASIIPFGLGLFSMFRNKDSQAFHDLIFSTVVTEDKLVSLPLTSAPSGQMDQKVAA